MSAFSDAAQAFLFDLLDTPSPSGFEAKGQAKWRTYVGPLADEVAHDAYGNTWATRAGTAPDDAPRLMLEAHADEIGFMIKHISDQGLVYVGPIGGSDRAIARGQRVHLLGDEGIVNGVIGNTAIHLRKREDNKIPEWHEVFIDIGAASKADVAARGLRVGHPAVYATAAELLTPKRLIGRALDNRIGGFILSQVLARLASAEPTRSTVYAVNAVQEEIGCKGAQMVTYRLRPDVAVVLDVTHATDTPGLSKAKHGAIQLGAGPTLTHGTANHPKVVERLMALAKEHQIPIQHEASSNYTGTDTDTIYLSRQGIPSALISLPMRYMHSTIEMVDVDDVSHCIDLMAAFAQSLGEGDTFTVL